jgi:flagellar assembly protein FliH
MPRERSILEVLEAISMLSKRVIDSERVRALRFENIEGLSESMVLGAKDEAAKEVKAKDLSEIEREAYEKAFAAGQQSGLQMAEKKTEIVVKRFAQSLEEVAFLREKLIKAAERDLVELSIEIAKKLVHREIQIDEKIIATLVRVALERLAVKNGIKVTVNPLDAKILDDELQDLLGEEGAIDLKTDEELRRGDCVVESDYGSIDARISQQFKEIEEGLLSSF